MRMPHVDDLVRLVQDIPELELSRGEIGVVRSTWCSPYLAFEVEFHPTGQHFQTRCLLAAEQLTVEDSPMVTAVISGAIFTDSFVINWIEAPDVHPGLRPSKYHG